MSNFDDLQSALGTFTDGIKSLGMSRAINNANDQVNQIKATETDQAKQRNALQGVAQNLTMQMSGMGASPEAITTAAGAIKPPGYESPEQMYGAGLLHNDANLKDQAQQWHDFSTQDDDDDDKGMTDYQKQDLALKYKQLGNTQDQQNAGDFDKFTTKMNGAAASSRSGFGQWYGTDARGERLDSIMGDPNQWKSMTPQQLELVTEGAVQMSKGSSITDSEHAAMAPMMASLMKAKAETAVTGKPTSVDLSPWAGMYSKLISSEGDASKVGMLQNITNVASGNAKTLYKRDPDAYKNSVSSALSSQLGVNVKPEDVKVDSSTGQLNIPGVTDKLQLANNAPKMFAQMKQDLADPNASAADKKGAMQVYQKFGLTPDMNPKDAIKVMQRHIRSGIFNQDNN